MLVVDLLTDNAEEANKILADFKPALSKEEYVKKLDGYFTRGE